MVLGLLPAFLRHVSLVNIGWLPDAMQRPLGEYSQIFYALLLITLIRIVPDGLFRMQEWPHWLRGRQRS